jgi:glycosyltransferase involved in cell wall biosynthesis
MIKVLMISTDAKILEEGSAVCARMREYGKEFLELHIIVFTGKKAGGSFGKRSIAPNVFIYPTNSVSKIFYVTDAIRIGTEIISENGFDDKNSVITTQDPFETGLVGMRLAKSTGVALHVQIHTDLNSPYFKRGILNKIRLLVAKRTLQYAQAVRAVSERIRVSLSPIISVKAEVLPIYADVRSIQSARAVASLRSKYPQFKKIALIASRLTKEKDISMALEAFAVATKNDRSVGLVIVGAGPEKDHVYARVGTLGLNDRVVFESWADRATVISYMKTCDIFLSSSLYEGYGLSMLEAYAAGAVLVATDAGIAVELAGEVCEPGDKLAFMHLIERALNGDLKNKSYSYPYASQSAYMEGYRKDIERALL